MRHFERIHIAPEAGHERFVSIIDKGNNHYASAIDNLANLTVALFLKAACFFRLPKNAFAIIDIYQIIHVDEVGKQHREHVFDYTVHNSRGTLSPLDKLPDFLESEESLVPDPVTEKVQPVVGDEKKPSSAATDPKTCTTVCGDGIKRTIPCEDPSSTHAACQGGPKIYSLKCDSDDAPVDQ